MYHNALAEFIRAKMSEKNLSTYAIARASGGKINPNTVTRILNGEIKEARKSTLDAIAEGLGVEPDTLYAAAEGKNPDMPQRFRIYADKFDAGDLTETEWQFLEIYFKETVDRFKADKAAIEQRHTEMAVDPKNPIAAVITPGSRDKEPTREDVKRMLDLEDDEEPTKQRKTG